MKTKSLFFTILLVASIAVTPYTAKTQGLPGNGVSPVQPPALPITEKQLRLLFDEFGTAEAQKAFTQHILEAQRSKLPAWFPQAVWSEVIRKVEDLDTFSIALPVYQKYLSEDSANALILFYDGDTGKQLARAWTEHARKAMDQGYRGGDAALKAEDSMGKDQDVDALMRKRMSELTPEQGNSCLDALQAFNQYIARINSEKNTIYMSKVQEIGRKVFEEHKAELSAAQQKASSKAVTR